jgi:hypothetical protein
MLILTVFSITSISCAKVAFKKGDVGLTSPEQAPATLVLVKPMLEQEVLDAITCLCKTQPSFEDKRECQAALVNCIVNDDATFKDKKALRTQCLKEHKNLNINKCNLWKEEAKHEPRERDEHDNNRGDEDNDDDSKLAC